MNEVKLYYERVEGDEREMERVKVVKVPHSQSRAKTIASYFNQIKTIYFTEHFV